MDDMNDFLILTPSDKSRLAADAFRLPHNSVRYVKPSTILDDDLSRETTPCYSGNDETPANVLEYCHRILFDSGGCLVWRPGESTNARVPVLCLVWRSWGFR